MDFELSSRFVEEDYCRLCLSSIYELRMLFPRGSYESNFVLISKIGLLAEVIIVPSEELNARICSRCVKQLEEFDSFRRRCKDSDNQIRKIRACRQQYQEVGVTARFDNSSAEGTRNAVATTADEKFGGLFDVMTFCKDNVMPGEYRMLFDGFVYRRNSLLVWRCELAICPCQLILENGCRRFRIYGAHSHGKVPLDNDKRHYETMNQSICSFLNKLRDQIDGTIANSTQQILEPVRLTEEDKAIIYYSTKGDRPSIVLDGHRYHKEAVSSDIVLSEINWRCSEKNCLGMVVTTTDLKRFQMYKGHNHESIVRGPTGAPDEYILKITTMPIISDTPPQAALSSAITPAHPDTVTIANIKLPAEPIPLQVSVIPRSNLTENPVPMVSDTKATEKRPRSRQIPNGNSSANQSVTTQRPSVRKVPTAPLTHIRETPQQQSSLTSPNEKPKPVQSIPHQRPTISILPSTSSNQANTLTNAQPAPTDCAPPVAAIVPVITSATNSDPNRITPCKRNSTTPVKAAPNEKLKKTGPNSPIMPSIAFRRCPNTNGICLIHKQFVYSSQPTNSYITWNCKIGNCRGMLRTGWQFEYLSTCVEHNHEPSPDADTIVDVERHIAMTDALQMLAQLRDNLVPKTASDAAKGREKMRRKSTRS